MISVMQTKGNPQNPTPQCKTHLDFPEEGGPSTSVVRPCAHSRESRGQDSTEQPADGALQCSYWLAKAMQRCWRCSHTALESTSCSVAPHPLLCILRVHPALPPPHPDQQQHANPILPNSPPSPAAAHP